ncbi:MAG: dTDP-4-dehydrorhamnose reductase [Deltaproteobacteria bacterium]
MNNDRKKLALIGANGMLARMVRHVAPSIYDITSFDLPDFDITNRDLVLSAMMHLRPYVIVNCAAYTDVDRCETNEELALLVNGSGPGYLAEAALDTGATLVHISTDYVFTGDKTEPYSEDDPTGPLSSYGQSKLEGEKAIMSSGLSRYFIIRTSWLYGPGGKNFVETILRLAGEREELRIVADQHGSPTYTEDLANAISSLLEIEDAQRPYGIYHVSNSGSCSWYEFAVEIVRLARLNKLPIKVERIIPISTEDFPLPAKRPSYSVFSKQKYETITGQIMPEWRESLIKYFAVRQTL